MIELKATPTAEAVVMGIVECRLWRATTPDGRAVELFVHRIGCDRAAADELKAGGFDLEAEAKAVFTEGNDVSVGGLPTAAEVIPCPTDGTHESVEDAAQCMAERATRYWQEVIRAGCVVLGQVGMPLTVSFPALATAAQQGITLHAALRHAHECQDAKFPEPSEN